MSKSNHNYNSQLIKILYEIKNTPVYTEQKIKYNEEQDTPFSRMKIEESRQVVVAIEGETKEKLPEYLPSQIIAGYSGEETRLKKYFQEFEGFFQKVLELKYKFMNSDKYSNEHGSFWGNPV